MTAVAKSNGSLAVARWVGIGLTVAVILVGTVLYVSNVQARTNENCMVLEQHAKDIEAMKAQDKVILEAIHRFDKRQTLVMHKLGVVDHGDPGDPGTPD